MNVGKVLGVILGVLLVALGIWCMLTPVKTYSALAWLIGLAMIVDGVSSIAVWFQLRQQDMDNVWTLVAAIISVILGIILTISLAAQIVVDFLIVVLAAIWLIAMGAMRIAAGMRLRAIHVKGGVEDIGKRWWLAVVMGVLVMLVGILSLFDPIVLMLGIGMFMGGCIVVAGVSAIGIAAS